MKYTRIQDNAEDNTFSIFWSDNFYAIFQPYCGTGSYNNIYYRLFGLRPRDFYHYVGANYNATFRKSPVLARHVYMRFANKNDAIRFANEIDRRIEYCVHRGDFTPNNS